MMRLVAFLALLPPAALALRKPGSLADSHHAVVALSERRSDPLEGTTQEGTDEDINEEDVYEGASQNVTKQARALKGSVRRGMPRGAVIGPVVGGVVPLGAQGIQPVRDAALNGFLFSGLFAGIFELLHQALLWVLPDGSFKKDGPFGYGFWGGPTPTSGMQVVDNMMGSAVSGSMFGAATGAMAAAIKREVLDPATTGCQKQEVQDPFNLTEYISAPWYPQWQNSQEYQKATELDCTSAEYTKRGGKWDINVLNRGGYTLSDPSKMSSTSGFLCGSQQSGAKLVVGPCALRPSMGGPYWVIKYTEGPGLAHAVIIGGQPDDKKKDGTCGFKENMRNGMWIFTRKRVLNSAEKRQIESVKTWMKNTRKLDTLRLLETPQHNCR